MPARGAFFRRRLHGAVAAAEAFFAAAARAARTIQPLEERDDVAQLRAREHLAVDLGHGRGRDHALLHLLRVERHLRPVTALHHDAGGRFTDLTAAFRAAVAQRERDQVEARRDVRAGFDHRLEQVLRRMFRADAGERGAGLAAVTADAMATRAGQDGIAVELLRAAARVTALERKPIRRERVLAR